jgi:hypothetical protein
MSSADRRDEALAAVVHVAWAWLASNDRQAYISTGKNPGPNGMMSCDSSPARAPAGDWYCTSSLRIICGFSVLLSWRKVVPEHASDGASKVPLSPMEMLRFDV